MIENLIIHIAAKDVKVIIFAKITIIGRIMIGIGSIEKDE